MPRQSSQKEANKDHFGGFVGAKMVMDLQKAYFTQTYAFPRENLGSRVRADSKKEPETALKSTHLARQRERTRKEAPRAMFDRFFSDLAPILRPQKAPKTGQERSGKVSQKEDEKEAQKAPKESVGHDPLFSLK